MTNDKKVRTYSAKKLNANCLNFLREIIGIFLGLFCWKERERERVDHRKVYEALGIEKWRASINGYFLVSKDGILLYHFLCKLSKIDLSSRSIFAFVWKSQKMSQIETLESTVKSTKYKHNKYWFWREKFEWNFFGDFQTLCNVYLHLSVTTFSYSSFQDFLPKKWIVQSWIKESRRNHHPSRWPLLRLAW